jgi:hypothetical protein
MRANNPERAKAFGNWESAATVHRWRDPASQVNVSTGVNFTVPEEVLERLRKLKANS